MRGPPPAGAPPARERAPELGLGLPARVAPSRPRQVRHEKRGSRQPGPETKAPPLPEAAGLPVDARGCWPPTRATTTSELIQTCAWDDARARDRRCQPAGRVDDRKLGPEHSVRGVEGGAARGAGVRATALCLLVPRLGDRRGGLGDGRGGRDRRLGQLRAGGRLRRTGRGGRVRRAVGLRPLLVRPVALRRPRRPPGHAGVLVDTLDQLSAGRLDLGLGAGWNEDEFRANDLPFPSPGERLAMLEECLEILRRMLTDAGTPASYQGKYYRVDNAPVLPGPVQRPRPPLWVGGSGDRMLGLIACVADGWNVCWAITPEEYDQRLEVLRAACARVERPLDGVRRSIGLATLIGRDADDLAER